MPLVIRPAALADARDIVEMNRRLALETENKVLDLEVLTAGVRAGLGDPHKATYFVAQEDDRVVGQLMLTLEWSDWRNGWIWWIQSVYVLPEARRRGVFRALYHHVHDTARAEPSVVGLRLYMERENHQAASVYTALGMEHTSYVVLERCPVEKEGPVPRSGAGE